MSAPPPELIDAMAEQPTDAHLGAASSELGAEAQVRLRAWLRSRVAEIPAQHRRRRQRRRFVAASALASCVAAAAAVMLAVQVAPDSAKEAVVSQPASSWQVQLPEGATLTWLDAGGSEQVLHRAGALPSPGRLQTDATATAQVTAPNGVRLQLAPSTRLRTPTARDAAVSEVELAHGAVDVQVPPLGTRRSFRVRTRDTEVIVHGTRFRVEIRGDGPVAQTCVRVQEGKVEVRGPRGVRFLGPGQAEGCEPVARPRVPRSRRTAKPAAPIPRSSVRPAAVRKQPQMAPNHTAESASEVSLVEQNRWLMRALAAERNADLDGAKHAFEQLLSRYPESQLAPEARRGLARVSQ